MVVRVDRVPKKGPAVTTDRSIFLIGALVLVFSVLMPHSFSRAADPAPSVLSAKDLFPLGGEVYREHCAACHDTGVGRAPQRIILSNMTPASIHAALTSGVMREQAANLTEAQKIAVAEHLSQRELTADTKPAPLKMCGGSRAKFDLGKPPAFSNWGLDLAGTHAIATDSAGLDRKNVGKLRLKWAFGFEDANRVRSQPAIAGGAIFVGAQDGSVFALDRETGCVRWRYRASAEVRTGIIVSPWQATDSDPRPLAYFGDWAGNAYAVNALTGDLVWKVKTDEHPASVVTGTPSLYRNTLYVPVSSLEEATAASPTYSCCSFRGSILALDATTGTVKWRTWLVDEPKILGKNEMGVDRLGPSGVPVWNSPAIDPKRNQLYIATGDNYDEPVTELSDSIVALNLATGKVKWHYQALAGDAWNVACVAPVPANCPQHHGPDFDFGAGAVLAKAKDGRELVLAAQKGGVVYGVDPDTGKLAWHTRAGRGGMAGGIHFGLAAMGGDAYVPVTDMPDGQPSKFPASPGMYALDVATGDFIWKAPAPESCAGRKLCLRGYSGAISVTSELVLAGADDAHIRIYDAATGKVLWDMDTDRDFATVNDVPGHGGAMSGSAAPIANEGELIVASGYGFVSKMPGNVLLVFQAD
jgi:polyvinyl alcohol dehydrogenase (cytochrome)